jgi:hypothetical protein
MISSVDLEPLLSLARSDLWSDRALAGRELGDVVGDEQVDDVVRALLLDPRDTAVTEATAEVLPHAVIGRRFGFSRGCLETGRRSACRSPLRRAERPVVHLVLRFGDGSHPLPVGPDRAAR